MCFMVVVICFRYIGILDNMHHTDIHALPSISNHRATLYAKDAALEQYRDDWQILTYRHMINGSAHFTTKCTHTCTNHTYGYMKNGSAHFTTQCIRTYTKNTYRHMTNGSTIQTYEKCKRKLHYSMHTPIYKYIHTDI
jgi:hypothetical protein